MERNPQVAFPLHMATDLELDKLAADKVQHFQKYTALAWIGVDLQQVVGTQHGNSAAHCKVVVAGPRVQEDNLQWTR